MVSAARTDYYNAQRLNAERTYLPPVIASQRRSVGVAIRISRRPFYSLQLLTASGGRIAVLFPMRFSESGGCFDRAEGAP